MPRPFHFPFFVRDLASMHRFYGEILGRRAGPRSDKHPEHAFTA